MRKLLKIFLPPFVGFALFFVGIRYSSIYFTLRPDEMGAGDLASFMAFYRYLLPLLFTVAVLTQILIIVPAWRSVQGKPAWLKINAFFDLSCICLLFALGIAYTIWDTHTGTIHLFKTMAFLFSVQMVYWIINLFTLKMIS